MSDFRLRETDTAGEFVAGGLLTIEHAELIRIMLIDLLDRSEPVLLRVGDDVTADLSFLQLLCSAHRSAVAAGKTFGLKASPSGSFAKLVRDAGYFRNFGCRGREETCLWLMEGNDA